MEGYAGEFINGWLHGLAPRPYPGGPLDDTPLEHIRSTRPFSMNRPLPAGLHIPLPNGRGWIRAKLNASHVDFGEPAESSESQADVRPANALPCDVTAFADVAIDERLAGSHRGRAESFLDNGEGRSQECNHSSIRQFADEVHPGDRGRRAVKATAGSATAASGGQRDDMEMAVHLSGADWMDARAGDALAKKLGY